MKILFVSPALPVPVSGGRTRLYFLIKELSKRHEISLISFVQPADDDHVDDIANYCSRLELVQIDDFQGKGQWHNRVVGWSRLLLSTKPRYVQAYPVKRMEAPFLRMVNTDKFDAIVFEQLFLVELSAYLDSTPSLLIEQNVESDIAAQKARNATNTIHKIRDRAAWYKLLHFERHWLRRFPVCVAVSDDDAKRINKIAPNQEVVIVPNGVDNDYFKPFGVDRCLDKVLFFGSLSYGPNVDALDWFCHNIWPKVYGAMPNVVFEIVGLRPGQRVQYLSRLPGIQLAGFVSDIRQKLWDSTLTVVPLRVGGGTRLKILEAMAAQCPIVSTNIGAEGLDVEHRRHLLIADAPDDFAGAVLDLLKSPGDRASLAEKGRQLSIDKYDWQTIAPNLEYALAKTIEISYGTAG